MDESTKVLTNLSKLGNAKIAGLVCNKNSPMLLRVDVQIPVEQLENALDVVQMDASDELISSLESALASIKKSKSKQIK